MMSRSATARFFHSMAEASDWPLREDRWRPFPAGQIKAVDGGFSGWNSHLPIRVGRRVSAFGTGTQQGSLDSLTELIL